MIPSHTRSFLLGIRIPPCPSRLHSLPINSWWWMGFQSEGHLHPWAWQQIRPANVGVTAMTRLILRPSGADEVVAGRGVPLQAENCPLHAWQHVQLVEPESQITHLGLTLRGSVMHHVYGLTYTRVGFCRPCFALINTHTRASRKASWWMCACSRGCLHGAAADRCRPSLWKTLLTNGVSAIHQAHHQLLSSSSSAQPFNVDPPAHNFSPKMWLIHNGRWSSGFINSAGVVI